MRIKRESQNPPVPPADIILDLLNDVPGTETRIILFYEGYIQAAATEPLYTEDGIYKGIYRNEDLMQEIKMALLKAIPPLKRNILKRLSFRNTVVVILTKDDATE